MRAFPPMPQLPFLPSFKDLIDTSPPVFYSSSQITDSRPIRSRQDGSRSQEGGRPERLGRSAEMSRGASNEGSTRSRSRSTTAADSPRKRHHSHAASFGGPSNWSHPQSQSQYHPHPQSYSPSGGHNRRLGLLAGGSASTTDLTGEWEPLAVPPAGHGHVHGHSGLVGGPLGRSSSFGGGDGLAHGRIGRPTSPPGIAFPPSHGSRGSPIRHPSTIPPLGSSLSSSLSSSSPSSSPSRAPVLLRGSAPTSPIGNRPSHRRSHSAVPAPTSRKPLIPLGRLQEYSRNPLTSSSALSLPTLAEGDDGSNVLPETHPDHNSSTVTSPILQAKHRRGSKAGVISPISPPRAFEEIRHQQAPPKISLPPPARDSSDIDIPKLHKNSLELSIEDSSVPPPQPRLLRPPMSPHSRSTNEVKPRIKHAYAHSIASAPSARRVTTSSPLVSPILPYGPGRSGTTSLVGKAAASVSDIAVMATWAFPPSPPRPSNQGVPPQKGEEEDTDSTPKKNGLDIDFGKASGSVPPARVRVISGPSERLRDRLRTLSMLDTGVPVETSVPTPTTTTPQNQHHPHPPLTNDHLNTGAALHRNTSLEQPPPHWRPRLAHQVHRHTFSTPVIPSPKAISGWSFPSIPGRSSIPSIHSSASVSSASGSPTRPTTKPMKNPPLQRFDSNNSNASTGSVPMSFTLSSSPGSMTSTSTCPSPTSSVTSLVTSPPLAYLGLDEQMDVIAKDRSRSRIPPKRSRTIDSERDLQAHISSGQKGGAARVMTEVKVEGEGDHGNGIGSGGGASDDYGRRGSTHVWWKLGRRRQEGTVSVSVSPVPTNQAGDRSEYRSKKETRSLPDDLDDSSGDRSLEEEFIDFDHM